MSEAQEATSALRVELTLADGRTGSALGFRDEVLAVVAPCAFAPGQPVVFTLSVAAQADATAEADAQTSSVRIEAKAVGSKRRPDGTFDVRVRVHSLRREQRAWLLARFPSR